MRSDDTFYCGDALKRPIGGFKKLKSCSNILLDSWKEQSKRIERIRRAYSHFDAEQINIVQLSDDDLENLVCVKLRSFY
jgi:hypothetical protein